MWSNTIKTSEKYIKSEFYYNDSVFMKLCVNQSWKSIYRSFFKENSFSLRRRHKWEDLSVLLRCNRHKLTTSHWRRKCFSLKQEKSRHKNAVCFRLIANKVAFSFDYAAQHNITKEDSNSVTKTHEDVACSRNIILRK